MDTFETWLPLNQGTRPLPSITMCVAVPLAMARERRLDAPDTLYHAMVRGVEQRVIVRDDADRTTFVARLARLAEQGA
ncbi:MAG: hypothetical protein H6Q86_2199 [candidate division NC10 bacterium]|nr:hypothetical protein [candidate division NC10 bacterium]